MKYSFIIPVYNRPGEVAELLESLQQQRLKDFEVIVVEDGSQIPCKDVCDKFADILALHYYAKQNSGPGQSRNYGVERARGEWVIILDSDVVLPPGYLEAVDKVLAAQGEHAGTREGEAQIDAFGGPDASHPSFTPVQKAISYSMTSFFTTGGIRGGGSSKNMPKRALDKFYPRSFNMGIRRDVYLQLGGFSKMRFGEDIDFSYRIVEAGHRAQLIPEAWVWHKRRTDFRKFFRQVYNSGIARINLEKRHPGTMKLVHMLPMAFTLCVVFLSLLALIGIAMALAGLYSAYCGPSGCNMGLIVTLLGGVVVLTALSPLLLYSLLLLVDSAVRNRSLSVGLLSVPAAFVQLMGYGFGFLEAWWKRMVLKQDEFTAFEKNFYK